MCWLHTASAAKWPASLGHGPGSKSGLTEGSPTGSRASASIHNYAAAVNTAAHLLDAPKRPKVVSICQHLQQCGNAARLAGSSHGQPWTPMAWFDPISVATNTMSDTAKQQALLKHVCCCVWPPEAASHLLPAYAERHAHSIHQVPLHDSYLLQTRNSKEGQRIKACTKRPGEAMQSRLLVAIVYAAYAG